MRCRIKKAMVVLCGAGWLCLLASWGEGYETLKTRLVERFQDKEPREWGEAVTGVKTRLKTDEKVIALTLDACGSEGDGYDEELISFLQKENKPATLFISGRWINKNPETFLFLASSPLFEIANHGFEHKPASTRGRSVYGIEGTRDVGELVDEIERNARKIERLTGERPRFYRSGTAYYDEVAVEVAQALGHEVAGFDVLGDKGATYSREEVVEAFLQARPGSIVIAHMNRPERETANGVKKALSLLREKGFRFVKLSGYPRE